MKRVIKHPNRCQYCSGPLPANESGRGRRRLYCRPSHRLRAYEKRTAFEAQHQTEKPLRQLHERLKSLDYWRRRCRLLLFDEMRQSHGWPRTPRFQLAVDKVRELFTNLAPEVIQDLQNDIRRELSLIEANQRVQQRAVLNLKHEQEKWTEQAFARPTPPAKM